MAAQTKFSINQSEEPKGFITLAVDLGYTVNVTGGLFNTHEITCTQEELLTLRKLAKELQS